MTDKEKEYRTQFRNIGKHLHKNEYLPINLANHPMVFIINSKEVLVNWGWAARDEDGKPYIRVDIDDKPHPYEGFWEARLYGCGI